MHRFERSAAWEATNKNSPCLAAWLRKYLGFGGMYMPSDLGSQLAGIDVVDINTGATADLKLREKHYGDFLVETDTGHGKPGWALQELRCTWVVSFCIASCWGAAVRFEDIHRLAEFDQDYWLDDWRVEAKNERYTTVSYALTIGYLKNHGCPVIHGPGSCAQYHYRPDRFVSSKPYRSWLGGQSA